MKEKYVLQKYPRWFVFGEWPDGRVDVSDGREDIATQIPRSTAEKLIARHNVVVDTLVSTLCDERDGQDGFEQYYCGSPIVSMRFDESTGSCFLRTADGKEHELKL